jgi:hypothetical protein
MVVVDNDLKWIKVKAIIDYVVLSIARFLKDETFNNLEHTQTCIDR